jgi:hypothetical protein
MTKNMHGGYRLNDNEKNAIKVFLQTHETVPADIRLSLGNAANGDGTIEGYDSFDAITEELTKYETEATVGEATVGEAEATTVGEAEAATVGEAEATMDEGDGTDPTLITTQMQKSDDISSSNNNLNLNTYATLNVGTILYFPTQDIKNFDDTMMFAKFPNVLDQSKQRTFTMFFTENEEYARRFSGIWSLNKRNVYIHTLRVKTPITRIKIINSKKIPDNINNYDLALGMCGDSIDGAINGIKIEQNIGNAPSVAEYYICNPSAFFEKVETSMQFSGTEWIKIDQKNIDTIKIPGNNVEIKDGDDDNMDLEE